VVALGGMAAFALAGSVPGMLAAAFVWGCGSGGNWVFSSSELQRRAPAAMLGRLAAADQLVFTLAQSAAVVLVALVIDATGAPTAGALVAILAGGTGALVVHGGRRSPTGVSPPDAVSVGS
jgi:hypothetical protein